VFETHNHISIGTVNNLEGKKLHKSSDFYKPHFIQAHKISSLSQQRKLLLAKFVNQMVASVFELTADKLLHNDRGHSKTTRARQIAIYLMHTCLSFSLTEIAKFYHKDRTTISYSCRVVEDLRDTPAFDERLQELEQTIQTVLFLTHEKLAVGEVYASK